MTKRLSAEDWLAEGFRALTEIGPQALKAEPLARRLGTTKGSFYWHFADVPAFKTALLQLWKDKAVTQIIDELAHIEAPAERLRALAEIAGQAAPDRFGGPLAEPALRAWSLADPEVAQGVEEVDAERIDYLRSILAELDKPEDFAVLIYGAYVGLDDLGARKGPSTENALKTLVELILA